MSTPFQNRLVGTIIVAAVVIIFLPDVLDGEKKSHQADFEAIPQVESFSGTTANKPFPEDKLIRKKDSPIVDEQAIDDVDLTVNEQQIAVKGIEKMPTVEVPKLKLPQVEVPSTKKTLPEKAVAEEAWVIHLGSFKNKDNVDLLLSKLKKNGYVVFTKPIKTKQGTLTKVIIGPELIKSSMEKKLPKLKALTNIQGKVAYFEVNK